MTVTELRGERTDSSVAPAIETTLANGLRVLIREDHSAPVVALVTRVRAGYFDETDDIVGIAHVLEHMYFKGTPRRGVGEISRETKAAGGYLNAGTIYDHTTYYAVLPSSGFERGLDIQADAYANSLIDSDELSKELEVIIQEAKRKADTPGAVAIETLYEVMHDRHRIRRWRIGREPGLRALTSDHVRAFYRNFYHPGNTILVIAGDIDAQSALARVETLYGSLASAEPVRNAGPHEPPREEFRYRELSGDIAQTQLVFGWRTPGTAHPDTTALDLLASVLATGRASRLYRAVRERQLAASVSCSNYTPTELGVFQVHADTPPERLTEAARAVWREIARIRNGEIDDADLDRAKRIVEARWVRRLETMEGQANHLAEWEALGSWRMGDTYLEEILALRPADLVRVAKQYLSPEHAAAVVYRPKSSPAIASDAAAFRTLMDSGTHEPAAGATAPSPTRAHRAPAPTFEREEVGVRVYRTAAGIPLLVRRKPGVPLVHLGVFAGGGACLESPEHAGLTLLMARTQLKGTTHRDTARIAEDAEGLGGAIGVGVGAESFGWSLTVPAKHLVAAMELLGEIARDPVFPAAALETERVVALADVKQLRDDMYRWPMRLAMRNAFPNHPYGSPVSGTEESIPRINREAIAGWHAKVVARAPLVIGIVGDIDPDEAARVAAAAVEGLEWRADSAPPAPQWPARSAVEAESREKAQTALAIAFPGPSRRDPRRFAAEILAGIASGLGGRFFDELRDKQSLAYTVQAFPNERRMSGTFLAYIATSPEKEETARAGLLREFEKLRESPVGQSELQRAVTYALGTHAIRQQSGASQLSDMIDAWLLGAGLKELAEYEGAIRAVTAADIQSLARAFFDPARRIEGLVRGVARSV